TRSQSRRSTGSHGTRVEAGGGACPTRPGWQPSTHPRLLHDTRTVGQALCLPAYAPAGTRTPFGLGIPKPIVAADVRRLKNARQTDTPSLMTSAAARAHATLPHV